MVLGNTSRDHHTKKAKLEDTPRHWAAQADMRIELENRCTGKPYRGFESHPLRQGLDDFRGFLAYPDSSIQNRPQ